MVYRYYYYLTSIPHFVTFATLLHALTAQASKIGAEPLASNPWLLAFRRLDSPYLLESNLLSKQAANDPSTSSIFRPSPNVGVSSIRWPSGENALESPH